MKRRRIYLSFDTKFTHQKHFFFTM